VKLLTLNVEDKNFISLIKSMTDGKGDEVLFVDWVPLSRPVTHVKEGKHKTPIKNIDIVQSTPKDVKLVIFDRYSALTKNEVDIYLKRDAVLLEPVLRPRPGFLFMPYWVNKIDLPLSTWEEKRPFHTGVKTSLLHTEAYVTMVNYSRRIDNLKIGISTNNIPQDRLEVFKGVAEFGDFSWNKFRSTLIVGTDTEHRYGVLPDIRSHLKYGVIPIVSHNHKWFHALFKNFIEFDTSTMVWYHKMCEKISGYGFMDELYKNINNYMPEMFTKNFVETLISLCKK
jgi:hypothetical protein